MMSLMRRRQILKEAEAFGPEGKGIDGSGEKETDKQPNEPIDKPHA